MNKQRIVACRICGNTNLAPCIDIGEQYLSSIFPDHLSYRQELEKCPLEIVRCVKTDEQQCGALQLAFNCDISGMYQNYPYTSSSNTSMRKILEDVANSGKDLGHLKAGDTILDIGCNDGTLLSFFEMDRVNLIGIDPAQNVASRVNSPGFVRVKDFFSRTTYEQATRDKASLIFSVAMFYHLSNPVQFCQDIAAVLKDDGAVIIQMAYLPAMINTNMYDNIVHEHVGYYGIHHMKWILEKAGLELFDVLLNDVYGGSFRLFAKKRGTPHFKPTVRLAAHLIEETAWGIFEPETYAQFMSRIQKSKADLQSLLGRIRGEGKKVWVYGASTKGNTILQFCHIGADQVEAAADSNAFKFGKFMIGSDIPIKDEKALRAAAPDYLLALPYSFVPAFREREKELVQRGVKFIVPLPEVHVI